MQRCNRWCRGRMARAAPHHFPPPSLLPSLSLLPALFVPSLKRSSPRVSSGGRVVGRRRNKNAGNRRGTSCRAHHFTACAGLRSCVQQDFARISFLCPSYSLPSSFLRIVAYFFIRCPFIISEWLASIRFFGEPRPSASELAAHASMILVTL